VRDPFTYAQLAPQEESWIGIPGVGVVMNALDLVSRLNAGQTAARSLRVICCTVLLGAAAPGAWAQQGGDDVEELVVTAPRYVYAGSLSATKTDAPLVEIPQAVTVISRDQIDLLNWSSVQQSVRYTAGVNGENFGPDERYDWLTLRGFAPVQYIDGLQAPIGSVNNVGTDLYGFEWVDILKGPSSVLYGQTPPGGIVNMRSRRPSEEFGGEIEGQLGNLDFKQLAGDVTGALGDRFTGRLTALYRDRESQVDHVDMERIYVAPALGIDLGESTSLTLLNFFQRDEVNGDTNGFLPAFGTALPNPLGSVPVGRNLGEPDYNKYERDQWGAGYDFSHSFSDAVILQQNLKFFSADADMLVVYGGGLVDANFDGVPDDYRTVQRFNFPFKERVDSFNVDTRGQFKFATGGLEHTVLVGIDYRRYENESSFGFAFAPSIDLFNPVYGAPITTPPMFPFVEQTQEQTGVYVQDQIKVDRLVLTLSGRQDWLDTENFDTQTDADEFSYRAGLNYVFDSGISPYVQVARSFQPVSGADFDGNAFEPSTGDQIEAGIKYDGRTLESGNKLFASMAVYELTQENVLTADPDPTHPFFSVQAGEVEVKGLELEVVARFQERLTLNASYTYTDSEVTKSNGADLGKDLPMVPEQKISGLIDYTFQDGALAGLGAGLGARHLSDSFGDGANAFRNESVTLYDAILHYDTRVWRLTVNASNLTDKTFVARCSSFVDCFYGAKRLVTGSVTYKF
jgi:iron complex outermembrane receptor protein